ncbi:MAG: type II toxin-antitoxin system VapC family toxin [Anaerolineae bacterium]|nr:type II toxin-antitoxin system VapC family toxin [Anaerolineae bacterium]
MSLQFEQALSGITRLGFDTAPLIYYIELNPDYVDAMREIIRRLDAGVVRGYSSSLTLTEVLTKPIELGRTDLQIKYQQLLVGSRHFSLVAINNSIAITAAEMRARYNLRTPDALQIAAAMSVGCQAFLTNDQKLRRVKELKVLLLSDLVSTSSPS